MPATGQESGDKQDTSFLSTPGSTPGSKSHQLSASRTPFGLQSILETPEPNNSFGSKNCTPTLAESTPLQGDDTSTSIEIDAAGSPLETNEKNESTEAVKPESEEGESQNNVSRSADENQHTDPDNENLAHKNSRRSFGIGRGRGKSLPNRRYHNFGNPETQAELDYQSRQLGRKLFGVSDPHPSLVQGSHSKTSPNTDDVRQRYSEELTSLLTSASHNDGLFGRFPGDHPKNYNKKVFSPPLTHDDGYNNLFRMTRIKTGLCDQSIDRMVTDQGIIAVDIPGGAKLFLNANGGIRLMNENAQIMVALSPDGGTSALIHPAGRIYQYGSRVEICAHAKTDNLLAKMWYKGISFALESAALVYLLDDGGTRTVHDIFSDMSGDFTTPVFLSGAETGPGAMSECGRILAQSRHWNDEIGLTENWEIAGIRITRTPDDVVRIIRGQNKYQLRACGNGLASISTPYIHCTASYGKTGPETSHIFVRRGERRLHYDGATFILRNGGHSAGFDYNNEFSVF